MVGLLSLGLVAAACGTRVDKSAYLHQIEYGNAGPGSENGGLGSSAPGAAATGAGSSSGTGAGTGVSSTLGSSPSAGPNAGSSPPIGPTPSGGSSSLSAPGNATGPIGSGSANPYGLSTAQVGNTVLIGIHVPETGAAPLPMGWQQDIATIQNWMNANPVNGRRVSFDVQDDRYDPSGGETACNKILGAKPLVVIGWTMPTIELECGQLFSGHRIPYITRGTASNVETGCSVPICYFATMSDDLQGKLAGDYVIDQMGGPSQKIGMVYEDDQPASPRAFTAEVKAKGGRLLVSQSFSTSQSSPDFSSDIVKLQQAGCQTVLLSMPPVDAITLATQAQSQGYHPTWFGLGTYWNYNMTLESAGMAMDGAVSFSPWASIDSAAANQWKSVNAQYGSGAQADDVGLVLFGVAGLVRGALIQAGPNLSAASLVSALNRLQFSVPFWAPAAYTSSDHLGPLSVAVFKADGQAKRWDQITGFTARF